jgi:mannose-6-phosphate isomerase-like protein (cupin superfamily)
MYSSAEDYINSGILQEYNLGLLSAADRADVEAACNRYPEVKEALAALQQADDDATTIPAPPAYLQDTIWALLHNINKEQTADLQDLPVINKYADHLRWLRIVQPLLPPGIPQGTDMQVLRSTGGITQVLVCSATDVPDEVHTHERESFLVLEGECACHIGSNIVRLGPGGYIEIPMYTHHHVVALSARVVAILQRIAV